MEMYLLRVRKITYSDFSTKALGTGHEEHNEMLFGIFSV